MNERERERRERETGRKEKIESNLKNTPCTPMYFVRMCVSEQASERQTDFKYSYSRVIDGLKHYRAATVMMVTIHVVHNVLTHTHTYTQLSLPLPPFSPFPSIIRCVLASPERLSLFNRALDTYTAKSSVGVRTT